MATAAEAYCLVDYCNVRSRDDENANDVGFNLTEIFDRILEAIVNHTAGVNALNVRFYGGWIDETGFYTPLAQWLLATLPDYRQLRRGVRVLPTLAITLDELPKEPLIGTLRVRAKRRRQKMVDTMIVMDLRRLCTHGRAVILASDDDDFIPAWLGDAARPDFALWLRLREPETTLNQRLLDECRVRVRKFR
jgi:hypothetical protein